MIFPPDRISELRDKLAAGDLAQSDCDKAVALMEFDQAVLDRDFVQDHLRRQEDADDRLAE